MSKKFVPELDYYFSNYWRVRGEITTENVPISAIDFFSEGLFSGKSFLKLLFDEVFEETEYNYLFTRRNLTSLPVSVRERIRYSGKVSHVFYSTDNETKENIFDINEENVLLLNKLFEYRTISISDISDINYEELENDLSKLIYIYLNMVLNDDFGVLNNQLTLSDSENKLSNMFELYVINEAHKKIKNMSRLNDSNEIFLNSNYVRITITKENIETGILFLEEPHPHIDSNVYIYHNGILVDINIFDIAENYGGINLTWNDQLINIKEGDTLIMQYYYLAGDST